MSQNMTPDDGTDEKTSVVDVRTTDLSEFENGEAIRVHYRDDPTSPSKTVTGRVEVHYTDEKAMIETEDDRPLIVDLGDTASDGGLRDFDTSETVGRPMFAETAYHPEKDGQDLKDELLGEDDDEDDDENDEDEDDDEPELVTDGGRPKTRCVLCGFRPEGPAEGLTTLPEEAVPEDPFHATDDAQPATAESPPGAVWVCHGCRDDAQPDEDADLPSERFPRRVECPACSGTAWGGFYSEEVEVGRPTNTNTTGAVAPHYRTTTVRFCEFRCVDCKAHDRIEADRAVLLRGPSDPDREEAERVDLDSRSPPSDPPEPPADSFNREE